MDFCRIDHLGLKYYQYSIVILYIQSNFFFLCIRKNLKKTGPNVQLMKHVRRIDNIDSNVDYMENSADLLKQLGPISEVWNRLSY